MTTTQTLLDAYIGLRFVLLLFPTAQPVLTDDFLEYADVISDSCFKELQRMDISLVKTCMYVRHLFPLLP